MTARITRIALVLLTPLLLASCILTPGKFTSALSINADRSFAFSYVGEVIAVDADDMTSLPDLGLGEQADKTTATPDDTDSAADKAKKQAAADRKNRSIAAALSKEAGYRRVEYLGNGKFSVDYAIKGVLDHSFVYPFNIDAEAVFPFIAVELRADGSVRVKAPGFAADSDTKNTPGADKAASLLDGTFTLDTDAEVISQNSETGATAANGRKTIMWKATPLSKDAPMAMLRLKPAA